MDHTPPHMDGTNFVANPDGTATSSRWDDAIAIVILVGGAGLVAGFLWLVISVAMTPPTEAEIRECLAEARYAIFPDTAAEMCMD